MKHKLFADLMEGMLQKLRLPAPENLQQDTCTISFEYRPDIHFVNVVPGFLDIISHIGILPLALQPEKTIDLLALNSFDSDDPFIAVTLHPPTGTISLLTRQNINEINIAMLLQLTEAVYKKCEMVKTLLAI